MLGGQCINIKLKKNDGEDDVYQTIYFRDSPETHQQIADKKQTETTSQKRQIRDKIKH